MRFRAALVFDLFVLVFFTYMVWEAWEWAPQARLFPWVVGIPMLILAAGFFVVELRRGGEKKTVTGSGPVDLQFAEGIEPTVARSRAFISFAWIIGFLLAIWLVGFSLGTALMVFAYLKFQACESWVMTITLTCGAWLIYFGLFEYLLKLPFPDGRIFVWLGM